jgi:oligopeptide/dipeptide ABC transporter ATP-binding protein
MSTPLLELRNLSTVYPARRGMVNAVDSINLSLGGGDILGLVGESGCGKSTVLLSILRLIRKPGYISGGEIMFRGKNLRKIPQNQMRSLRGREIAMIFQDPLSTLNPVFQVGEQIREALQLHNIMNEGKRGYFWDSTHKREKARVLEVMEEVGISTPQSRYRSYPHEFSGGMMQRALIAIALACNPAVLLADEPTTALDVTIQAQILSLMKRINQDHGTAIILVTHDLGVAAEFCDSIAVMYAGRIVEKGSVDQVVEDPQHPYTKGLLQCRPRITPVRERIAPIPGNVPDLSDLPEGCAFGPRCADYRQVCSLGPVPMVDLAHKGVLSRCLIHTDYERNPLWTWGDRVDPAHPGSVTLLAQNGPEESL